MHQGGFWQLQTFHNTLPVPVSSLYHQSFTCVRTSEIKKSGQTDCDFWNVSNGVRLYSVRVKKKMVNRINCHLTRLDHIGCVWNISCCAAAAAAAEREINSSKIVLIIWISRNRANWFIQTISINFSQMLVLTCSIDKTHRNPYNTKIIYKFVLTLSIGCAFYPHLSPLADLAHRMCNRTMYSNFDCVN